MFTSTFFVPTKKVEGKKTAVKSARARTSLNIFALAAELAIRPILWASNAQTVLATPKKSIKVGKNVQEVSVVLDKAGINVIQSSFKALTKCHFCAILYRSFFEQKTKKSEEK